MALKQVSSSFAFAGFLVVSLSLLAGCGGGGGGNHNNSSGDGNAGTGGGGGTNSSSIKSLALLGNVTDTSTSYPVGLGTDGLLASVSPSSDGTGGTVVAAGVSYPVPTGFYVISVSGTQIDLASDTQSEIGLLNSSSSSITIKYTFTGCSSYVAAADGTTENEYTDTSGNLTKLTIVKGDGVEHPVTIPDPSFLPTAVSDNYITGAIGSTNGFKTTRAQRRASLIARRKGVQLRTGVRRDTSGVYTLSTSGGVVQLLMPSGVSGGVANPNGINNNGVVVGSISNLGTSGTLSEAVTWNVTGGPTVLATPSGYSSSEAWVINDGNIVAGDITPTSTSSTTTAGAIWQLGNAYNVSSFSSSSSNYTTFIYLDDKDRFGALSADGETAYLLQGS